MERDEPILTVTGLTKKFKIRRGFRRGGASLELVAVNNVDLALRRGESVGLVGESGCGKSTLGRCLVGLYSPTSGSIKLDGVDMTMKRTRAQRRAIQMVFQDPYSSLNPRMTVGSALREVLRVNHVVPKDQIDDRAVELLEMVGLDRQALDNYPSHFSGGQRQRVAIARALALEPAILVADEPVSALDVSVQATVLNLLADLRESLGLTMLFVSHSMAVIRHVSDRVVVMRRGEIVERGEAKELFANPQQEYTKELLAAVPRLYRPRRHSFQLNGDAAEASD